MEVALTAANGSLDDLATRQKTRKTCQCPSRKRGEDQFDEGLNPLFDDRADEEIQYEDEIRTKLAKGKKPDRVVGLRLTKRLDRILHETEGREGDLIADSIRTTPFQPSMKPLLFPFLLIEAKSEKSPDAFSKIDAQSGFALRSLLQLQRDLLHASAENRQSGVEPLVWYLAYRGEQWRLSGAYVEEKQHASRPNYRILQLWGGDITDENEALRLLLILDYVFDWARDIYRREIICGLLSLAPNASQSLIADTDVGSTYNDFAHFGDVDNDEPAIGNNLVHTEPFGVLHLLKFFDKECLAFRDARYMAHKVWALHVTLENLDDFLSKMNTTEKAMQLARQLWRSICGEGTWSVTADCLNAVEKLWTGQDREPHTFQNPEQPFLASFAVDSYFTRGDYRGPRRLDLWDQVHALTYVAIAHDAVHALRERTKFRPSSLQLNVADSPEVSTGAVLDLFSSVRFASVQQCFAGAIARSRLSSQFGPTSLQDRKGHPRDYPKSLTWSTPILARSRSPRHVSPAGLPRKIYKLLKIGMAEPSESFLRVSQQFTMHNIEATCGTQMTWASSTREIIQKYNAVLVEGVDSETLYGKKHPRTWYCLFVLDMPSTKGPEGTGTFGGPEVFGGTLRTFFNVRLGEYNFRDTKCEGTEELGQSLEILEHVSTQYSLIQSMDAESRIDGASDWIQEKYKVLTYPSVKWSYTFSETIAGIKQVGEDYGFSQTIHRLIVAFQTVLSHQDAESEFDERPHVDLPPLHHFRETMAKRKPHRIHSSALVPSSSSRRPAHPHDTAIVEDARDTVESRDGSWSDSSVEIIRGPKRRRNG
ncbi:hypothetical protein CLAIMM_13594 [Cladophialophora immunda]|nr:hypothetical protein CLAIMM_13594 [Cladophialophora immunda]